MRVMYPIQIPIGASTGQFLAPFAEGAGGLADLPSDRGLYTMTINDRKEAEKLFNGALAAADDAKGLRGTRYRALRQIAHSIYLRTGVGHAVP